MKTRSNMPLFVVACTNIKQLTNEQINMLRCGDWVVKKTGNQEHAYKVTFKSPTGICLTYMDASVIETQSYDLVNGNWVYNSEDKTSVAEPLMENIVDADGHNRFIEWDMTPTTKEGITITYAKASLCGTHLMFVIAGNIANGTTLGYDTLVTLVLPKWILDKIIPVWGSNYVVNNIVQAFADDWSHQDFNIALYKNDSQSRVEFNKSGGSLTISVDRSFRIAFDLLIDNE